MPARNRGKGRSNRRKVGADPPATVLEPWNQLTISWETPVTDAWYKIGAVASRFSEITGISSQDLVFRFHSIDVWGSHLEADSERISLQVFSLIGSSDSEPDPIKTVYDAPGRNTRANVHYRWRKEQRMQSVRNITADNFIFGIGGKVNLIHLHVSWRTNRFQPSAARAVGAHGLEEREIC